MLWRIICQVNKNTGDGEESVTEGTNPQPHVIQMHCNLSSSNPGYQMESEVCKQKQRGIQRWLFASSLSHLLQHVLFLCWWDRHTVGDTWAAKRVSWFF